MKRYSLCGMGHAVVDLLLQVSEPEFKSLGFDRAGMQLVSVDDQRQLLERFQDREVALVSGGSLANSVIAFAQLGGTACFLGCVGDDRYGLHYVGEMAQLGIVLSNPVIANKTTGTCVSIVTPDAERTMRTALGVASELSQQHINEELIAHSEWLFIEGYLVTNKDTSHSAIRHALQLARKHSTKIAFTFSESFVVGLFPELIQEVIAHSDLVFANEAEACAFTGCSNAEQAFAALKKSVPACVLSAGANGAYVRFGESEGHVASYPAKPRDLTGAGDMLAGAFLYGITQGVSPLLAARAACCLAKQVIEKVGARLDGDVKQYWDQALTEEQAASGCCNI